MSYYCGCGQRMKCVKTGARVVDDGGSIRAADVFACSHDISVDGWMDVGPCVVYVVNDNHMIQEAGFADTSSPFFLEIHG